MSLLIPDSGPLFSLAAGDLLDVLLNFNVGITDVVKQETIDRGSMLQASIEAKRLWDFYSQHSTRLQVTPTQVGMAVKTQRAANPRYSRPRNIGELSIQSLLIDLQTQGISSPPVVLFEDAWFLRHAASFAQPCVLISTEAFLINAEALGLIKSASRARAAIAACRPDANLVTVK
jgi:hypothetical protein